MNWEETRRMVCGACETVNARIEPTSTGSGHAETAGATPAWARAQIEQE